MLGTSLVSVLEEDPSFRDSMKRLMRSLGNNVEAYSSAADFLVSPRLIETACLIALRKPVDEKDLRRCIHAALRSGARREGDP
jgi:hypothetical protein